MKRLADAQSSRLEIIPSEFIRMTSGKTSIKPSETLFVEWDQTRLLVIQGSSSRGVTALEHAFSVERDPNLRPAELGEVLKQEINNRGLNAANAVIVFPRELVTFSRVTVPNLAVEELPDLVRMQAATKLTVPVESVCLDFTPLPVVDGMQTRDALLVTAPLDKVNGARAALKVCGLEVVSVQVSSFAIAQAASASGLLNSENSVDGLDVVLSLSADQIEMLYVSGTLLSFSHSGASWTSEDKIEQAIRSEVSRAQMAATEAMGGNRIARVTLLGTPEITAKVPDDISKRLSGAEVRRVDSNGLFTGSIPESISPTDLIGLAGSLAQISKSSYECVDLINPRKPIEKPDHTRLKRILVVGLCALAFAAIWKWRTDTAKSKQAMVVALEDETRELKAKFKASRDLLELDKELRDWDARDLNWLDEMERVQNLMGGTDRVLVKKFVFNLRKGDYLASLDAQGFAKSRPDVEDLMKVMVEDGYEIRPGEITPSLRDPAYQMELRIEGNIPEGRDEVVEEDSPAKKKNSR